ncbi:MAG: tripartite tricarboxylate transporter substrate binding protein [Betaproteobacteria bacterium]|nr:tripartite tricarboxylate transporter substrate binding protein [Betaproteobacteria bacterium]
MLANRFAALLVLFSIAVPASSPVPAFAQSFPSKPIRIIFPFTAGSLYDSMARLLGQQITDSTGQPVIVENRPGASSIIGMTACAKAAADGYTVCMTTADSVTYNPLLFSNLPYDADKDLTPVTNLAWPNGILVAHVSAPFATFKEMIAHAKANPGKINFATWGAGSIPEVHMNWIKHRTGVDITNIPYKGAGQAFPALLTGEAQASYIAPGAAMPHIKSGKIRAIATTGARRSPFLPEIPSMEEEGVNAALDSYMGIFAPSKTPQPILDRLHAEFVKALSTQKLQDFLRTNLVVPGGTTPAEFAAFLRRPKEDAARAFKTLGLKPSDAPTS